jgi:transcriptional regulator with XRE-family HTH domain
MNASQVGRLVSRERSIAGLTQAELAERLGTTQAAVSKIETGRSLASLRMLDRIARALGRPITLTLGADPPPLSRPERRARVAKVLGDYEFDPWQRQPTAAEAESLLVDGLTRERFQR